MEYLIAIIIPIINSIIASPKQNIVNQLNPIAVIKIIVDENRSKLNTKAAIIGCLSVNLSIHF